MTGVPLPNPSPGLPRSKKKYLSPQKFKILSLPKSKFSFSIQLGFSLFCIVFQEKIQTTQLRVEDISNIKFSRIIQCTQSCVDDTLKKTNFGLIPSHTTGLYRNRYVKKFYFNNRLIPIMFTPFPNGNQIHSNLILRFLIPPRIKKILSHSFIIIR